MEYGSQFYLHEKSRSVKPCRCGHNTGRNQVSRLLPTMVVGMNANRRGRGLVQPTTALSPGGRIELRPACVSFEVWNSHRLDML
jgi:hypothetical protein